MTARTILITGARAPIALDLARSFAAAGWAPHLVDSIRGCSTLPAIASI
jgi:NADP-dependent 3-hydroxy acid dehydrogenase YdfG